ncbi:MAG: phosphoribosylpyrophosphate synthetase [Flavobacteriales bacterium]
MENPDNQYTTLTEAVNDLQAQGYTDELTLTEDGLFNNAMPLDPKDFTIDSFHRFEGPSDPADMAIVYAISSKGSRLKGLLIGEYGPNALDFIHQMVQPLQAHVPQDTRHAVQPAKPPGSDVKA